MVGNKANRYQYPSKREEGYLHGLSFESHLSGFEIREHFVHFISVGHRSSTACQVQERATTEE